MNSKFALSVAIAVLTIFAGSMTYVLWKGDHIVVDSLADGQKQEALKNYLATRGISYSVNDSGQIMVSSDKIEDVRRSVGAAGALSHQRVGFEIFQDDSYGATEFAQKISYQRALQGELEKTIVSLKGVLDARVHLAIPTKTRIFRKTEEVAASVVVSLADEGSLASIEPAVRSIIIGAVPDIAAESVSVIQDSGSRLGRVGGLAGVDSILAQERLRESDIAESVSKMLLTWFNPADFSVSVSVTMTKDRKTIESTAPVASSSVVRAKKMTSGEDGEAVEDISYEYGTKSENIEVPAGQIVKIGMGVAINTDISEPQIAAIRELISSAIGLDEQRGDSLTVIRLNVSENVSSLGAPLVSSEIAVSKSGPLAYGSKILLLWQVAISAGVVLMLVANRLHRRRQRKRVVRKVESWLTGEVVQ
ncbi:flagellar M-ring protein FliF C-terminal domain-containing protein [Microbulbifer sp. ALW1]|uniref:flagellar M-ring protein FliF C-terminal domain-containing protein n=1 Tax=Microbulbifer sp. (strain ALW1) TaxID=1516059 RepID=UPI00135765BA|nr:flagellar M-ring protein FliF C-terminal domain-containing protein [Microbulbifer sp. ALW1]